MTFTKQVKQIVRVSIVLLLISGLAVSADAETARSAGKPLRGWAVVGRNEWPAIGQALTLYPNVTSVVVRSRPATTAPGVTLTKGQATVGPIVLLAVGRAVGEVDGFEWWKVLVPARPNGTVGWVRSGDVTSRVITERIVIELSTNRLIFTVGGEVVIDEKVATGTGQTPTPTGLFAIKEFVPQKDPTGFLGPIALGLTGFSEVLYDYAGGQGTIALHGTSSPGKIGLKVSHGCIRLTNKSILRLAKRTGLGAPVEIVQKLSDLPSIRWSAPVVPE